MIGKATVVVLLLLLVWPASDGHCAAPMPHGSACTQPVAGEAAAGEPLPGKQDDAAGLAGLDLARDDDSGAARLPYQMLAYTLIILLLGGVGLFLVRKVLPRIASRAGKSVSVIETVYLGPKKALHLLQVGTQRFLVAGTRDQVALLGEVTTAFPEGTAAGVQPGAAGFASILKDQGRGDAEKL